MYPFRSTCLAAAWLLTGCAGLPAERGYAQTSALLQARIGHAPDPVAWAAGDTGQITDSNAQDGAPPVDVEGALMLAFLHNPRVRETYARLGLGRAELEQARRLANPSLGFARLAPRDDGGPRITRSLSFGFADLLLRPARKRFAQAELQRLQNEVASQLLQLSVEVETAWYTAVGAHQVSDMRALTAQAARASVELAQRFFEAGNINQLQLEHERAAAMQASIAATRALARSLTARAALATAIGLPAADGWTLDARLPSPPQTRLDALALEGRALEQRLDLAAATQAAAQRADLLGMAKRWRWLGHVEAGFEQDREGEDGVFQGPTLSFELPIFGQGQASVAKAQAEYTRSQAMLDAQRLAVRNEVLLAVQRLNVAYEIATQYRDVLVPSREAIVSRTHEQVNYMLMGVFELIVARREEYDAYQEYLEAVRDYWIARAELRGAVGGALPDDGADLTPTLDIDAMMPLHAPTPPEHDEHHEHGGTP